MKKQSAKKKTPRLGQHFLTNASVAVAMARAADIQKGDTVLEIGPGKGMLTKELLATGARVIAIEKDPAMVAVVKNVFAKEIAEKKLEIREMDIRDFTGLKNKYKVVANIPYYITGELIRMFLTAPSQPEHMAFLVQKEVAERIAREKKESILSLSVKVYGTPRYVKKVSRGNFNPPPSVDSAILSIQNISRNNFSEISEEWFFKVVKAGFAQKRKTLGGNLKRAFGATAEGALREAEINPQTRAEDVPLEKWLLLGKILQT